MIDLNELERLLKDYEESTRRLGQSNFCNQAENLSKAIYAEQRVKTVAVNALPGLIERVREAEKAMKSVQSALCDTECRIEMARLYHEEKAAFSQFYDDISKINFDFNTTKEQAK